MPEQEPEHSSGSREKLLSKESGLGKWGSMGTHEKFDAGELMAEVIEKSEEVRPQDMLDQPCNTCKEALGTGCYMPGRRL